MATNFTLDANCQIGWLFTDGSGSTVTDSSAAANNGTIVTATWSTTVPTYPSGVTASHSVNFAGASTDVITGGTATAPLDNTAAFTAVCWVNPTTDTGPIYLWQKRKVGTAQIFAVLQATKAVRLYRDTNNFDFAKISSSNSYSLNTWTHIGITGDASGTAANHHIYFNGIEGTYSSSVNGTGGLIGNSTGTVDIGNATGTTSSINGKMTDVGIFNRQLSASEIYSIYYYGLKGSSFVPRLTLLGVG